MESQKKEEQAHALGQVFSSGRDQTALQGGLPPSRPHSKFRTTLVLIVGILLTMSGLLLFSAEFSRKAGPDTWIEAEVPWGGNDAILYSRHAIVSDSLSVSVFMESAPGQLTLKQLIQRDNPSFLAKAEGLIAVADEYGSVSVFRPIEEGLATQATFDFPISGRGIEAGSVAWHGDFLAIGGYVAGEYSRGLVKVAHLPGLRVSATWELEFPAPVTDLDSHDSGLLVSADSLYLVDLSSGAPISSLPLEGTSGARETTVTSGGAAVARVSPQGWSLTRLRSDWSHQGDIPLAFLGTSGSGLVLDLQFSESALWIAAGTLGLYRIDIDSRLTRIMEKVTGVDALDSDAGRVLVLHSTGGALIGVRGDPLWPLLAPAAGAAIVVLGVSHPWIRRLRRDTEHEQRS